MLGLLIGAGFNLAGLLMIGWPTAAFLSHYRLPLLPWLVLLAFIGAVGGTLVMALFSIAILLSGGQSISLESIGMMVGMVAPILGVIPGATVAIVWAVLNLDLRERRDQGGELV